MLVGSDFTITDTSEILITVAGQETSTTLTTPITHSGIWGEITEEVLTESLGLDGLELTSAARQTARFRMRYRADLLSGDTVIDDLGRTWDVAGSSLLRDRRYIEYDLTRLVGEN